MANAAKNLVRLSILMRRDAHEAPALVIGIGHIF